MRRTLLLSRLARKILIAAALLLSSVAASACNPLDIKVKAGLQVMTNDVPASIFLDGQYLDKTPYISKEIKPGTYTLRIEPENSSLVPYETSVTLRKGLLSVVIWKPGSRPELSGGIVYEMEKIPDKKRAEFSVVTIPDSSIVKVDSENKGFAPVTINDIAPGQHEFEITLPSYETQKHTLNMVAGHHVTVTVKLAKNNLAAEEASTTATTNPAADASGSAQLTATPSGAVRGASTASSSASPSSRALEISGPKVRIKPTKYFNNGQEALRVRATPSNAGTELGFAPVGSEYQYLNEKSSGWFKIKFDSQEGWVSGQFAELIQP